MTKTYLGSRLDYIMTSPLEQFDDYNHYDLMGIRFDLEEILSDNFSDEYKENAEKRYNEVLDYIRKRLKND